MNSQNLTSAIERFIQNRVLLLNRNGAHSLKIIQMKLYLSFIFLLVASIGMSQTPQKVYSIAKEQRELSWYLEQENLWKKELENAPNSQRAWRNYYESIRAQWIINRWGKESERNYKAELDKIVEDCYEAIPNSFVANFLMYRHFSDLTKAEKYYPYLKKAYELDSLNPEIYDVLITYHEIQRNLPERDHFSRKAFQSNLFSSGMLNWAYNVLMECNENAILFTAGDNDTYPFWVLQAECGLRKDVTILNTSLMTIDDYRNELLNELQILEEPIDLGAVKSQKELDSLKEEIIRSIFDNNKDLPVHVATTAVFQFEEDFSDYLYLTGLTYTHSKDELDNIPIIRKNFEKNFKLDYLTTHFSFHIQDNLMPRINATYLPAMVKLYQHYRAAGDQQRMQEMENYLIDISKKADQYDTIQLLIEGK
jgi:uncharacterized protein YihD (DUF1040 family)